MEENEMQAPPPPAEPTSPPPLTKRPGLAAALSILPGLGHVYNGLYLRGLTFFAIIFGAMFIAESEEIFGFAVAFFWFFNIVDAYRQATLINYGYATDMGILDAPESPPRSGQGALWAGIVLIIIGFLAVLDRFLDVDIDRILDLWPFGLLGLGVWLVVSALRERFAQKREQPEATEGELDI